jgi:hypothetical protein
VVFSSFNNKFCTKLKRVKNGMVFIGIKYPGRTIWSVYGPYIGRRNTGRNIIKIGPYTAVFSWYTAPYTASFLGTVIRGRIP